MIVEIDDDCVDAMIVKAMAESYISITEMMKNCQAWHEDDIAAWKELLPALKLVGGWYSVDFEAELKKAKKKK
jgi:hypothetical protein